jgi:hypothetical protein
MADSHAYPAPRRFLVVGMQRSGTSFVHSALRDHPQVAMQTGEVTPSMFATSLCRPNERGETTAQRTASLLQLFDDFAGRQPEHLAIGLKTAISNRDQAARLVGCLATHGAGIDLVLVSRRDTLAQLASLRRAMASGEWHRAAGSSPSSSGPRVSIDADDLGAFVADCTDIHRLLEQFAVGRRWLHIDYERHVTTGAAPAILRRFLGVRDTADGAARLLKKVSPPVAEFVVNHAELARLLPQLQAAAAARPLPEPVQHPGETRFFLLHRARLRLRRGNHRDAVVDALDALDAAAEWSIESHRFAADVLTDALDRLQDVATATHVLQRIAAATDADLQALGGQIRARLGTPPS